MTAPLLEIRSLSAGYGDLRVLWDVDLDVRAGRVTVVLGRNGAGKTTLLSTVAGLLHATGGSVAFAGKDVTGLAAPARIALGMAVVQENKRVFKRRTVQQNLEIGGHTMPRREVRAAVEEAYEHFPMLAAKRGDAAGALSGGQQQMLAIAQALMPRPSLLMLDEPSAGLAPVIVQDVLATVTRLKESGIGILLVEQLVDQALSVADDVVVVEHGRAVSGGPAGQADVAAVRDSYLGRRREIVANSRPAGS